jgi:ferredoxin
MGGTPISDCGMCFVKCVVRSDMTGKGMRPRGHIQPLTTIAECDFPFHFAADCHIAIGIAPVEINSNGRANHLCSACLEAFLHRTDRNAESGANLFVGTGSLLHQYVLGWHFTNLDSASHLASLKERDSASNTGVPEADNNVAWQVENRWIACGPLIACASTCPVSPHSPLRWLA